MYRRNIKNEEFKDLLTKESIGVNNYNVNIKVPAFSGKILAASSLIKEDLPKEEEKIELDTKVIEESIKEIEKEVAKDEIVKEEPKKYESKKEKIEEEKVSEEETRKAKIRILNDKLEALQHLLDNLKNELEELKK